MNCVLLFRFSCEHDCAFLTLYILKFFGSKAQKGSPTEKTDEAAQNCSNGIRRGMLVCFIVSN